MTVALVDWMVDGYLEALVDLSHLPAGRPWPSGETAYSAYQVARSRWKGVYRWYVWPGFGGDRVASTDTCSARRRWSYA
jgi:hypothetical protein